MPDRDMERILEAACEAPSAGNLQAYRIFVIRDDEKKASVSGCAFDQEFVKDASLVMVFAADPETSFIEYGDRGRTLYCIQDATIAATFAVLKATDLGYSTAWIGSFETSSLKKAIGTDGYDPVAIIIVGKAGEEPKITPKKSLNELVQFAD